MNEQEMTERAIVKSFGIDAPGATLCPFCELWHWYYRSCPPILPLGTDHHEDGTTC